MDKIFDHPFITTKLKTITKKPFKKTFVKKKNKIKNHYQNPTNFLLKRYT
jgi:hypothetical protein